MSAFFKNWDARRYSFLLCVLSLALFCSIIAIGLFVMVPIRNHPVTFAIPSETGTDIEAQLSFDVGSRGVSTFIVHIKNVSDHILGLADRVRYYTDNEKYSRDENAFLLCLIKPWGRVPLNIYRTTAINSMIAEPLQPGQERTCEYGMQPGDLDRIGSREVTACVCYFNADPTKTWAGKTPAMLAAWSNAIQPVPREWGREADGIRASLQLKGNIVTVKVRNVSTQTVYLRQRNQTAGTEYLTLLIHDYTGMSEPLRRNEPSISRGRGTDLKLDPGEAVSWTSPLSATELQKLRGHLLCAYVNTVQVHGHVAESNLVPVPKSPWSW